MFQIPTVITETVPKKCVTVAVQSTRHTDSFYSPHRHIQLTTTCSRHTNSPQT